MTLANLIVSRNFSQNIPTPILGIQLEVSFSFDFNFNVKYYVTQSLLPNSSPSSYTLLFGFKINSYLNAWASGGLNLYIIKAGVQVGGQLYSVYVHARCISDTSNLAHGTFLADLQFNAFSFVFNLWYKYKKLVGYSN